MVRKGLQKRTLPITDRGTLGEHRYLFRKGGKWCTPAAIPRRNYFENLSEKELFQEKTSGDKNVKSIYGRDITIKDHFYIQNA